jgi:hypothetical protein
VGRFFNAQDIFVQYQRLRRNGVPQNHVFERLVLLTRTLSDAELVELGRMAQNWERQFTSSSKEAQPPSAAA